MVLPLSGIQCLFAPAGSGKTRELRSTIAAHVEHGTPLGNIVGMSYTRVGAQTLASRVAEGERVSADDLRGFRTLHSMCFRLLGLELGVVLSDKQRAAFFAAQRIDFLPESEQHNIDDIRPQMTAHRRPGNQLLAFFDWKRNRLIDWRTAYALYRPPRELYAYWNLPWITRMYDEYVGFKADTGTIDYTDMLEDTLHAGLWPAWADVGVLDEAQDSTPLQLAIVRQWAALLRGFAFALDEDQLIFPHAGATPEALLGLPGQRHFLTVNHRQAGMLVRFADRLIRRNQARTAKTIEAARDGGAIDYCAGLPDDLSLSTPTFILARAAYLLDRIAIDLERRGTPFVRRSGVGGIPWRHEQPDQAFAAFRAVQALREGRQISLRSLHDLYQTIRGPRYTEHGAKADVERRAATESDRNPVLISLSDLPTYRATPELLDAIRGDAPDLLGKAGARAAYWRRVVAEHGIDALYTKPAITLSTIHGVKGEEADDVYLIPDYTPAVQDTIQSGRAGEEDERRVLYVAVTRARERLFVMRPNGFRHYRELFQGAA